MVNRHTASKIRKTHRYLGIFLGIQFLMWTISGLYFSWTDIDQIHGDHFLNLEYKQKSFKNLFNLSDIDIEEGIKSIEIKEYSNKPYYWINNSKLYSAIDGKFKDGITKDEALYIAKKRIQSDLKISSIDIITETSKHHEFRQRKGTGKLPAYVISYDNDEALKAYISFNNGQFQTVRHRNWRIFDFLWMTHTMDYEGRDDFNNLILRLFSILGLITVMSGFLLFYISSPSVRKLLKYLSVNKSKNKA